jgi:hypothetical protein
MTDQFQQGPPREGWSDIDGMGERERSQEVLVEGRGRRDTSIFGFQLFVEWMEWNYWQGSGCALAAALARAKAESGGRERAIRDDDGA